MPRATQEQNLRLRPVAEVMVPLSCFLARGIKFARSADDLDDYDFATLELGDHKTYASLHYVHGPVHNVTLMLSDDFKNSEDDLVRALGEISKDLELSIEVFHWKASGGERMAGA